MNSDLGELHFEKGQMSKSASAGIKYWPETELWEISFYCVVGFTLTLRKNNGNWSFREYEDVIMAYGTNKGCV